MCFDEPLPGALKTAENNVEKVHGLELADRINHILHELMGRARS